MSTELKWTKTGLRLICDVPNRPAPRTRTTYPMPSMPISTQYLAAELVDITGYGNYKTGIRVTSLDRFPGGPEATYNLAITANQDNVEQVDSIQVTYPLNYLITNPLSGATYTFSLIVNDIRVTTKYAAVSIQTPVDDTAQQIETAVSDANDAKTGVDAINSADCLTNADKIQLMASWRAELQTQASLDASADALLITTEKTAYDNAITALSVGLIAAGAPSNWASVWPDGSTLAASGIMTSLSGWWATIAQKRSTLQVAIAAAQAAAAQAAAISAAATDAASKVDAALTTAANDATAKAAAQKQAAIDAINASIGGVVPGATSASDAVSRLQTLANSAVAMQSLVRPLEYWAGASMVTLTDGQVGNKAMRMVGHAFINSGAYHPIDPTRKYKVKFWARAAAGTDGILYFSLRQFVDDQGTPCGVNDGRAPYSPSRQPAHTNWVLYEHIWQGSDFQGGVRFVQPEFLGNYRGTTGYWEIQDVNFFEVTEALDAATAAQSAATERAVLAETTAKAYADGIVTAEEQRAINDATAKYNAAMAAAQTAQSTANAAQTMPTYASPSALPAASGFAPGYGPVLTLSDYSLWKVNNAGTAWDRILFASTGIFGQLIASQIKVDDTLRAAIVDAAHVKTQLLTVLPDSTDTGSGTVQIGGGAIRSKSILAQNLTVANFDNLIPNPNSELAAPDGGWPAGAWEAAGLYAMSGAHSGTSCRRVQANGASAMRAITPLIPVSTGDQFYLHGWGRAFGGVAGVGNIFLHLRALNASGASIGSAAVTTTVPGSPDSGWVEIDGVTGQLPVGTSFVQAEIYSSGQTSGAWAFFDDMDLRRMSDANVIVDGTLQALFARIARAIQSTNYVAGSAGNAPVGFCMSSIPFTTTYKDGTTDSGCLMELGGSANFGGYKVATINKQVMTAVNRIVNGTFWRGYAPWNAQPRVVTVMTLPPSTYNNVYGTSVTATQNFNAPGYTSGTVYLRFTPSASMYLNSGGGDASMSFRASVYLRNHATGVETLVYQTTGAYARSSGPTTWAPGQQSINVTSYLSSVPAGYGVACVIDNIYLSTNTTTANTTTYTGTIDVTGFELIF